MIKDNFYPTNTTWNILPHPMQFTKYVPDIPITERPAPSAYWLGWINVDNLPQGLHVSEIRLNNNGYDFTDITPQDNFDCGYSFRVPPTSTYISDTPIRISYYRNSISKWRASGSSSNSDNFCFANKADVMGISNGNVDLFCSYVIYNPTGETIVARSLNNSASILVRFTQSEWLSFLNGTTFTFSANGATVVIGKNDLETGTFYKEMSNGNFIRLFLVGYYFVPNRTTYSTSGGWTDRAGTTPSFMVHINTEYYGDAIVTGCSTTQSTVLSWHDDTPTEVLSKTVLRGCKGYFSFETLSNLNYNSSPYAWNETTLIFRQDSNAVNWVQAIFPIAEIEKHYNLNIRSSALETTLRPFYGYLENSVYAPYVTEDNEFTSTRITGNLEDNDFKNKLRLWQYDATEWEENDYTEEDRPPYTPGGDDNENIGDKITRPASIGVGGTNGFVTQYALTRSDVAQLGALLWTSFVDQDYWQNYLFSLALDTGTFQLSGLLNFFVSLKVYPFPLVNVQSFSSWGQDMYVGTGIVPLHFSSNLHTINNYCDYISGGHIDIPRYFNDYRDYINTEISLYLPFCGTVQLNPGDVIGNRIDIQYAIDFATGGCIAYVDLTTGDGAGYPVGALPGQIGADIPLTATAAGEVAARFIGDGLNVAGMIGGEVAKTGTGVVGALAGNPSGGSGSMFAGVAGMYGGAGAAMAADMASGLSRQGLQVLQRGSVGAPMLSGGRGFAAFGAPKKPYVQIRRGIYPEVTGLRPVGGAPAAATTTISALSGFIQGTVKADGLNCHQEEKEAIIALIASGIYV